MRSRLIATPSPTDRWAIERRTASPNTAVQSFRKEDLKVKKQVLNKRERLSRNELIAAGLKNHCPKATILNDGVAMKATDAIRAFEEASVAEKKATSSRAQYLTDVAAARAANGKVKVLVQPIKNLVVGTFGKKSAITAEFGFGNQSNTPTVETRLEAVEKLRATRTARGTKGSRQKAAIHGQVATAQPQQPAMQPQPQASEPAAASNGTNGTAQAALLSLNGSSH